MYKARLKGKHKIIHALVVNSKVMVGRAGGVSPSTLPERLLDLIVKMKEQ